MELDKTEFGTSTEQIHTESQNTEIKNIQYTERISGVEKNPQKTLYQSEQEKLRIHLFSKAINKLPLFEDKQVREFISEYEKKDSHLISAFLTDFLAENKTDFPYSENGEI